MAVGGRSLPAGRGARAMLLRAGQLSMLEMPRRGCCTHRCKQFGLAVQPAAAAPLPPCCVLWRLSGALTCLADSWTCLHND